MLSRLWALYISLSKSSDNPFRCLLRIPFLGEEENFDEVN